LDLAQSERRETRRGQTNAHNEAGPGGSSRNGQVGGLVPLCFPGFWTCLPVSASFENQSAGGVGPLG
jgi:hypothetical protein